MKVVSYAVNINPEPWAIGALGMRKRGNKSYPHIGPNGVLVTYQNAIRAELERQGATMREPGYSLRIWLARQIVTYLGESGRRVTRNKADGTNIFKATEDAMQGIVINNDVNCKQGHWLMMAQDKDVVPLVVIELAYELDDYTEGFFPPYLTDEGLAAYEAAISSNEVPDRITGNEFKL